MTPVEQGRHCTQCSKVVTDFTAMTNNEIIDYFARQGNVCGRFESRQLVGLNNCFAAEEKPGFSWKIFAIAAAVTGLFTTVHANAQSTLGKIKVSQSVNQIKDSSKAEAKSFTIVKGKIVDANDSLALPGVTVRVKGTTIGMLTDMNGDFALSVPSTAEILQISYIGYESYEAKVYDLANGSNCVSLKMKEMMLGEYVIVTKKPTPFYKVWWRKLKRVF